MLRHRGAPRWRLTRGVEVSVSDAVWLGDSADLLTNVSPLFFDGDASIPDVADSDGRLGRTPSPTRELWQLTPTRAAG